MNNLKVFIEKMNIMYNQNLRSRMKMRLIQKTPVLILTVLFFALPLSYASFSDITYNYNVEQQEFIAEPNLKSAGFWNLTGTPIFIDNSDSNNNWSKIASENDWCSGDGTLENPYLIENVTINAANSSTGCGIYIVNSQTEYFTIRNVTVYNAANGTTNAGIVLKNTYYGTLTMNNCSFNSGTGIYLEFCYYNDILGNNASNNSHDGICVMGNYNEISETTRVIILMTG